MDSSRYLSPTDSEIISLRLWTQQEQTSNLVQRELNVQSQRSQPRESSSHSDNKSTSRSVPRRSMRHRRITVNSNRGGARVARKPLFAATDPNMSLASISGNSTFPVASTTRLTQCFFCRQGGFIITCSICQEFSACFSQDGIQGCIAKDFAQGWKCPDCARRTDRVIPYPVPSRSIGGSRARVSCEPLLLYQIWLGDKQPFSNVKASAEVLAAFTYGRFIDNLENLTVLNLPFSDLADRGTCHMIQQHKKVIQDRSKLCGARIVVIINTHANPSNGGLLYGSDKFCGLDTLLSHVLDLPVIPDFSNSMFLVTSCGGVVHHSLQDVRDASHWFRSVLAFGGHSVDPLHVTSHFIQTLLDFHIFSNESLRKSLIRAYKVEVSMHTSVVVAHSLTVIRMVNAAWRRRPNGVDVRCCNQVPKYVATREIEGKEVILFRCKEIGHTGPKRFRVYPLPHKIGAREFVGERNSSHRIMIDYI